MKRSISGLSSLRVLCKSRHVFVSCYRVTVVQKCKVRNGHTIGFFVNHITQNFHGYAGSDDAHANSDECGR